MMATAIDVKTIAPIDHDEAMRITEVEFDRMLSAARELAPDDWYQPTDCTGWDVRAVMLHLLGAAESNASLREAAHQMRLGKKLFKEIGGHHWVDGVNEIQIRERALLTNPQVVDQYAEVAPKAVNTRRRIPAVVRSLPIVEFPEPFGRKSVGYLMDMVYTRDVWMHRVDIAQATGRPLVLTPDHDGRIVEDIVREWSEVHGHAFVLELEGPAGGMFVSGTDGESLRIDAVEFLRVLSGRGSGTGLLSYDFPL
ncbi:MAG: maleylpyruvate isomerase family mycothiol-dependent enzyme [Acidimicrobiia bacterium]